MHLWFSIKYVLNILTHALIILIPSCHLYPVIFILCLPSHVYQVVFTQLCLPPQLYPVIFTPSFTLSSLLHHLPNHLYSIIYPVIFTPSFTLSSLLHHLPCYLYSIIYQVIFTPSSTPCHLYLFMFTQPYLSSCVYPVIFTLSSLPPQLYPVIFSLPSLPIIYLSLYPLIFTLDCSFFIDVNSMYGACRNCGNLYITMLCALIKNSVINDWIFTALFTVDCNAV